jgi:hypothetical protein
MIVNLLGKKQVIELVKKEVEKKFDDLDKEIINLKIRINDLERMKELK